MVSASQQITDMQNFTSMREAQEKAMYGSSNELNQDMFLKLMLEQLKYQDPLNPMSNQDFLAQQAQFTQLSELQKLNTSLTESNSISQATSLIGKEVTMIDPNNYSKTISGEVEKITFGNGGAMIVVNGEEYPLGLVLEIKNGSGSGTSTDTTANTETTEDTASNNAGIAEELKTAIKDGAIDVLNYIFNHFKKS